MQTLAEHIALPCVYTMMHARLSVHRFIRTALPLSESLLTQDLTSKFYVMIWQPCSAAEAEGTRIILIYGVQDQQHRQSLCLQELIFLLSVTVTVRVLIPLLLRICLFRWQILLQFTDV